jgi:hypothetical protein
VRTLFHERNLGCGPGPATAINWFFENVEEGIILEDDCLPHPDFFVYCEKLLDRYRNSKRIMHISGNNYQDRRKRGHASYYFSMYTHNSGWATWRRAWQHFDFTCISAERRRDLWDSQWQISVMRRNGLAILPNVNLVSDIGVGHPDATHTYMIPPSGIRPIFSIPLPLVHPKNISRDRAADRYTWYIYFKRHTMKDKVIRIILDFIPDMMKPVLRKVAPCWSVEKQ